MYTPFLLDEQAQDTIRALVEFSNRRNATWLVARLNGKTLESECAPFSVDNFLRAADGESGIVEFTICFGDKAPRFYRVFL